jgi:mycothiol synthase
VTLPPGYSLRRPKPEDAEAVAAVMTAGDEAAEEVTAADVEREWHELDIENDVWLVDSGTAVVAVAGLLKRADDHVASEAYVDPEHSRRGLGSALLGLIEARARELAPGARLTNGVLSSNHAAAALVELRGYRSVRHFFRMTIDLQEPPPEPQWPDGLEPRPFAQAHAEAFYRASQEAFSEEWGHRPSTFEGFLRDRVEAPRAALDLWLGVWDGDEIAATMICERRYEMGWVGSIGVRRPWRRRGIGLALLDHAFAEFWRRGERRIGLGVDAQNPTGATRLYERAGMKVAVEFVVYEKRLLV